MKADKKQRIMVVDDERHVLVTLKDFLEFEGFAVTQARSAEEALKKLQEEAPDLIVLDISMPGMGGIGFYKAICSPEGRPRFPVLVLTARARMKEFFSELEVDGFLAKPCKREELVARVREILSQQDSGAGQSEPQTAAGKRRLVLLEDDGPVAQHISRRFEDAGYAVLVLQTGMELLSRAPGFHPDVVVMKEVLPQMNGSVVAPLLKAMPKLKTVPVVIYDETGMFRGSRLIRDRMAKLNVTCLDNPDLEALVRTVESARAG